MATIPTYEVYVDWDNDGGLDLGNFELGVDGWAMNNSGDGTAAVSAVRSHLGVQSLLVTWVNVASPVVAKTMTNMIIGRAYTFSAWLFVPTGDTAVRLTVLGVSSSSNTGSTNAWVLLSHAFTATATTHTFQVNVNGTPANGDQVYIDQVMLTGPGEDVTGRTLAREALDFRYGRDQARSLAAIRPGEITMELNNDSRDYSPDNGSSPLAGYVMPGRPILVRATWQGVTYDLFRGYLDKFTLNPAISMRSLQISAIDVLQRLADATVSTEVHASLQTGQAIGKVLDAAGWPADKRDIDSGASTCRWWWEEGTNALDAINRLVNSEGPPAFALVSSGGNFVFRDRHHRLLSTASTTSQATFRGITTEPIFSDFTYDIGWQEIINSVTADVVIRRPGSLTTIYETEQNFSIAAGETRVISFVATQPFVNAMLPVEKLISDAEGGPVEDYVLVSGSVDISLSRTSGQSLDIIIAASTATIIRGMRVRGYLLYDTATLQVRSEEPSSVAAHGVKSNTSPSDDMPWATAEDVKAIAAIILGLRAQRLPIVEISLINAGTSRQTQQLVRDLSDRITIIESETSTNHDFYIETITHNIAKAGYEQKTTFGCERVVANIGTPFTFDVSANGFNLGSFGGSSFMTPTTVFILDQTQLDEEQLGL